MPTIQGTYEAEGPNVSGAAQKALTGDVPATNTMSSTGPGGNQQSVAIDRRRRLRTSSEPARDAVAINYSGGDQTLTKASRGLYITTGGALVVHFVDSATGAGNDVTLSGLLAGQVYPFAVAIIRQSGSSAAGIILY